MLRSPNSQPDSAEPTHVANDAQPDKPARSEAGYPDITGTTVEKLAEFMANHAPKAQASALLTLENNDGLNHLAAGAAYLEADLENTSSATIWKIGTGGTAFVTGTGLLAKPIGITPVDVSNALDVLRVSLAFVGHTAIALIIFAVTVAGALWHEHRKTNKLQNARAWSTLIERVSKSRA